MSAKRRALRDALVVAKKHDDPEKLVGPGLRPHLLDSDGFVVGEGDSVRFLLGLNTYITAPVFESSGVLWISTPDHTPKSCELSKLSGFVGEWFKVS